MRKKPDREKYGCWTVLDNVGFYHKSYNKYMYPCRCECGNEKEMPLCRLVEEPRYCRKCIPASEGAGKRRKKSVADQNKTLSALEKLNRMGW